MTLYDDATPPASLKNHVIRSLRAQGRLRGSQRAVLLRALAAAAAALVLVTTGILIGRGTQSAPAVDRQSRFVLLLYQDETFQGMDEATLVGEYSAWADSLRRLDALVMGEKLGTPAQRLGAPAAPAGGPTGLFIVRAADHAAALAIARTCPHLRYGGGILVRPIVPT